jgi:hypothetical protein
MGNVLEIVQSLTRSRFTARTTQQDKNSEHNLRSWQTRTALKGLPGCDRSLRARLLGIGLKERIDGAEPVTDAPTRQANARGRATGTKFAP